MLGKRRYIFVFFLIISLIIFTGCSVRKTLRDKEVREFKEHILESNEKVKDLSFYFIRPYLAGDLVYEGDLEKEDFKNIIDEFDKKIDIEFMQRIGDRYWGGSRPNEFNLYIHVDENRSDKKKHRYDYQISSQYNKTYRNDENPENIDGYKTWYISDNEHRRVLIEGDGEKRIETWGIRLDTRNISPTGLTLVCIQFDGEVNDDLETDSFYFLEEKIENQWIPLEMKEIEDEIAWTDETWTIPINDEVEWEVEWEDLYGELSPGYYRIGKNIRKLKDTDYHEESYYANFEVLKNK